MTALLDAKVALPAIFTLLFAESDTDPVPEVVIFLLTVKPLLFTALKLTEDVSPALMVISLLMVNGLRLVAVPVKFNTLLPVVLI